MSGQHKAAFLDRDGVINVDRGYIYKIEDFEFIDGIFPACLKLAALGYKLIIATNQSGIGRGYYSEDDFKKLNYWMLQQFTSHGVEITDVYYCPYHAEHGIGHYRRDSAYRKPQPQMLLDAADKHDLNLPASLMIGDKISDLQAGRAAGIRKCYFIGQGNQLPPEFRDVKMFSSLLDLVHKEFGG